MSVTKPVRLQRKRTKGFKLVSPNGLPIVCVTRPTKWGNPVRATDIDSLTGKPYGQARAVRLFAGALVQKAFHPHIYDSARRHLAGRNLACYCGPDEWCHADALLVFSNASTLNEAIDAIHELRRQIAESPDQRLSLANAPTTPETP